MVTTKQYLASLRTVLRHLYDPSVLRTSLLLELFNLTGHTSPTMALRGVVIAGINALKPEAGVPTHSRAWRTHEVLQYRYVQQCSQEQVADQLGISMRHLRREEREAMKTLAVYLAKKFDLQLDCGEDEQEEPEDSAPTTPPSLATNSLAWLQQIPVDESPNLNQLLPAVLQMADGIASQYNVCLEADLPDMLPSLAVRRVALRQILLSLLTAAIRQTAGGSVVIRAEPLERCVLTIIRGSGAAQPSDQLVDLANLEMAQQLAQACGCTLETRLTKDGVFSSTLRLPVLDQITVLVIDDHLDTIQLLQRYTVGTSYRVIGVQEVEVFPMAAEICPRLILLDVMMPRVDGWELLGRLRQHPLTSHLPILVCTILPQEELAKSLGADGFLRKPVSRDALLTALDRHLSYPRPKAGSSRCAE